MKLPRVAVIGSGIAGLIAAKELEKTASIVIFEKARGVGGRMANRYNENFQFDFGAQHFTTHSDEFKEFVKPFEERGVIKKWHARFVEIDKDHIVYGKDWNDSYPHYVGAPKMNQLCKDLAQGFDVRLNTKVAEIILKPNSVEVFDEEKKSLGEFDWLICAIPSQQVCELLPKSVNFFTEVSRKKMMGCFSLMLGFESPLPVEWNVALVKTAKLSWITLENSKPDRPKGYYLTALARNSWADINMERDLEEIKNELIEELVMITKNHLPRIIYSDIHRWRYANIEKQWLGKNIEQKFFLDTQSKIAACGDWCIHGRIEAAFISGKALGQELSKIFSN